MNIISSSSFFFFQSYNWEDQIGLLLELFPIGSHEVLAVYLLTRVAFSTAVPIPGVVHSLPIICMFTETVKWSIWSKDWPGAPGMGGCGTQGTQFGLHLSSLGPLMIFQLPNFLVKKM